MLAGFVLVSLTQIRKTFSSRAESGRSRTGLHTPCKDCNSLAIERGTLDTSGRQGYGSTADFEYLLKPDDSLRSGVFE